MNYFRWWLAYVACSAAAWVLVPVSLAIVWLTKQVRAGEHHAGIELLCASANQRINRGRKRTRS